MRPAPAAVGRRGAVTRAARAIGSPSQRRAAVSTRLAPAVRLRTTCQGCSLQRLPAGYSTHQGSQSYGSRDAFWLGDGRWPLQRWLDGKSQTARLFARKYRLLVMGWGEFPANAACAPTGWPTPPDGWPEARLWRYAWLQCALPPLWRHIRSLEKYFRYGKAASRAHAEPDCQFSQAASAGL